MVALVLQRLSQWPCRKGRYFTVADEWPGDWRDWSFTQSLFYRFYRWFQGTWPSKALCLWNLGSPFGNFWPHSPIPPAPSSRWCQTTEETGGFCSTNFKVSKVGDSLQVHRHNFVQWSSMMFSEQIGLAMPDIWFAVLHSTSWAFWPVQRPGSHLKEINICLWWRLSVVPRGATITKWNVEIGHLLRTRVIHLMLWWFQPLWKILVSWGYYSQYMEKNVPNHQPDLMLCSSAGVWTCPIWSTENWGAVSLATLVTAEKVNTVTHPAIQGQGLKGSADISIKRDQINPNGKPKVQCVFCIMVCSRCTGSQSCLCSQT